MKKIEINLNDIFDGLPLGPKYGVYWKQRSKRLEQRQTARRIAVTKALSRLEPPDFIKAIIFRREQLHLSQAELANRLGTYQAVISRLETGQGKHRLEFLAKVYAALGLKLKITVEAPNDNNAI